MITPGTPEKLKPATSSGQASLDLTAVQPDLHPHAGQRDAEVRIVGQDRRAASRCARRRPPSRCCRCRRPRRAGRARRRRPARTPASASCTRGPSGGRCGSRVPGAVASCSKTSSTTAPCSTIGGCVVEGVRREELAARARSPPRRSTGPGRSPPRGCPEVPRHRLEPGDRVDGGPVLGRVVEPDRSRTAYSSEISDSATILEVGVHALGIGVEQVAGRRLEQVSSCSATCRQPSVRTTRSVSSASSPKSSDEPPGRRVPSDVHLEEALLRVHEALGQHQVVHRVGVDLRDAVLVADAPRPRRRGRRSRSRRRSPATSAGRPDPRDRPSTSASTRVAASRATQRSGGRPGARAASVAAVMVLDIVPGPGVLT